MRTKQSKQPIKPVSALSARPGLLRRLAAVFYDSLLLLGIFFVATAIILPLNAGQAFNPSQTFYPLYLVSVSFIFFGWFWTHGGQTPGSRAWKIKVLTLEQHPLTWRQAAMRFLSILLTLGLDLIWLLVNKRYLALYERWSGSSVFFSDPPRT
ncbi:MAG: RDD family protein [Methylococcales bacterium]